MGVDETKLDQMGEDKTGWGGKEGEVLWHVRKAMMIVEGSLMRNNKCTCPSLFTLNTW